MKTTTINASGEEVTYEYGDRFSNPDRGGDRRRKSDGLPKRGHQVAEMWEKHHEIARRLLLGEKNVDIARALNCTPESISSIKNSPVVQDKLTVMRAARDAGTIDLSKEIMDLAPIAIKRVREALESGEVMGRELSAAGILKEANGILDREIGKPTQTINTKNIHGHFSMEDILKIREEAVKMAQVSQVI